MKDLPPELIAALIEKDDERRIRKEPRQMKTVTVKDELYNQLLETIANLHYNTHLPPVYGRDTFRTCPKEICKNATAALSAYERTTS